jgi:hypothetical protein
MVKLPVKISLRHRGKALGLDSEVETMTLLNPTGEPLGVVSWDAVIDLIHSSIKEDRSHRAVRDYPRSRLAAKVRYMTPDDKQVDSVTCEIGGGGCLSRPIFRRNWGRSSRWNSYCLMIRSSRYTHKAKWPGSGPGKSTMYSSRGWGSNLLKFPKRGGRAC